MTSVFNMLTSITVFLDPDLPWRTVVIRTLRFKEATATRASRRLKGEFAFFQSLTLVFILTLGLFCQMYANRPEFEFHGTVPKFRKRNMYNFVVACLRSPKKHEILHSHVVVVQKRQRNVQKSVQSCCFAY